MRKILILLLLFTSITGIASEPCSEVSASYANFDGWLRDQIKAKQLGGLIDVARGLKISPSAIQPHVLQNLPSDFILERYASFFGIEITALKAHIEATNTVRKSGGTLAQSWLKRWVLIKMRERGIRTQADLAMRMGQSKLTQHFRRGKPSLYVLDKYARFFNVSLIEIYQFRDQDELNKPSGHRITARGLANCRGRLRP